VNDFGRRSLLKAALGILGAQGFGETLKPRPGCQANAWNLDPNDFNTLLTALREIKELAFEGFETNIRFVQSQPAARAQIESTGLVFIGAHTSLPKYEEIGAEKAAGQIASLAEQARSFGAAALVVSHSGLSRTGEFKPHALDEKARVLDLASKRCTDAGMVLAYHNHEPEFQNHAAEMNGLIEKTGIRLMFDIGHAWRAYPQTVNFFSQHQDRVYGLHVRDYHNDVSVPLGQGEFPLRDLAKAIRDAGWHGWLIDEEERPNMPNKPGNAATGPSRRTMREIFGV
jgi:sugar phosphate isomerase/epimerase